MEYPWEGGKENIVSGSIVGANRISWISFTQVERGKAEDEKKEKIRRHYYLPSDKRTYHGKSPLQASFLSVQ